MGGVDVCDQQIECYRTWVKTKKWNLKVALHFIDLSIVNAYSTVKMLKKCDYLKQNLRPHEF